MKLLTDNQNCVKIIESGSIKPDLHNFSFSLFTLFTEQYFIGNAMDP